LLNHRLELPSHTKQYALSFSLDSPRISSLSSISARIGEKCGLLGAETAPLLNKKNTAATKQVAAMKIAPVSRFYRRIRDKKIRSENKSKV